MRIVVTHSLVTIQGLSSKIEVAFRVKGTTRTKANLRAAYRADAVDMGVALKGVGVTTAEVGVVVVGSVGNVEGDGTEPACACLASFGS